MAKVGDMVRFLNAVGGGRVTKIKDNLAYVEDEDGFETPVLLRECVVVGSAPEPPEVSYTAVAARKSSVATVPSKEEKTEEENSEEEPEETPMGEKLNIVLGYEPSDLKHLSTSTFDTYLVNDSNYYLYFCYMTRPRGASVWTARYAGIVEPNIQVFIGELTREELPEIDHVAVQYIAFKRHKEFVMKSPASIDVPFDATKFAKLHCFRDNTYFDVPVIAFELVTNDSPMRANVVKASGLEEALKAKKAIDRPRRQVVRRQSRAKRQGDTIVVDLHITELIDNLRGLSNGDMLNIQIDEFSRVMDENIKNKGQKIVFIHGKGEGVLRNAIMKELTHRYKGHDVQDASFREYGFGATQVTIR